jgi:hypothetical protein
LERILEQEQDDAVEVELIDFSKAVHEPLVEFACGNYTEANKAEERGYKKGLKVYGCECGQTAFAAPWDDAMAAWISHKKMPPYLRQIMEEKGMAPNRPPPSPHVIICDASDAHLLSMRRWRVFPTRPRCRAKVQLQGGPRGMPFQRLVLSGAKNAVRFINGSGTDVRRENLRRVTRKEIADEMNARRAARRKATMEAA